MLKKKKKRRRRGGFKGYFGGGGGGGGSEPPAKTVNVLNLQIWKILPNFALRENSQVFQQVKDFFSPLEY